MSLGSDVEATDRWWVRSALELGWRWTLIVGCLVLFAVVLVTGTRESTWDDLRASVAAGDVQDVTIEGGLSRGHGYGTVEVTWRHGLLRHRAEVIEARPLSEAPHRRPGDRQPVVRDVQAQLTALDPDLGVSREPWPSSSSSLSGWELSTGAGFLGFGLFLATLLTLSLQPPTWRATRWAWFWLVLFAPPLGLPAYLLLGGPTGIIPAPRDPRRRLTGGWAFLLAIVVSAFSDSVILGLS